MSKLWKPTNPAKFYEALGAIADERFFDFTNENSGKDGVKVYSSNRDKFYTVTYNSSEKAIMSNDNPSYWQGYLGYPGIVYLLLINELPLDLEIAALLQGISWNELNTKYKNNYMLVIDKSLTGLSIEKRQELDDYVASLVQNLADLKLVKYGPRLALPKKV